MTLTSLPESISPVLSRFASHVTPKAVVALGNAGGFSGARFWRVRTVAGDYCLRRWPREHPTPERLSYIHGVLRHIASSGFEAVPAPLATTSGESFVAHAGHLWEFTPWMPGRPADVVRDVQLRAAMRALAQFHVAAATSQSGSAQAGMPRGLAQRTTQLDSMSDDRLARMRSGLATVDWPEFANRASRILDMVPYGRQLAMHTIQSLASSPVPLQPCIRDIWQDHVFFEGDAVTAVIDFGAMREESVAGDAARLLGSLVGDDTARREIGLAAYEAIRQLSPDERQLITAYDRSGVVLGGMNWIDWIAVDHRHFDDRERVIARLDELVARLEHLVAR